MFYLVSSFQGCLIPFHKRLLRAVTAAVLINMPRKESAAPISAQAQQDLLSESIENFELPKSLVTKIAKSAVSWRFSPATLGI
jgi:hypothetical protein